MPPSEAPAPAPLKRASRACPDWREAFARNGVALFPVDDATARWAASARRVAVDLLGDPELRAAWLRCEGTWFAGVDVLPNGPDGGIAGVPLAGPARDALAELGLYPQAWHRAQLSVAYPGYPRPKEGESPGAARYRMTRDAAHVDGMLPVGAERRRMLREPHSVILGLSLRMPGADAAPLVVWPGSHRLLGSALRAAREAVPDSKATDVDLTASYRAARRAAFGQCARMVLPMRPGQAVLLHRHLLHGIAPWRGAADGRGRMTAYFRPLLDDPEAWFQT